MLISVALPIVLVLGSATPTADAPNSTRNADQAALADFAGLVGDWKGTGQPQRSSAKGSWRESGAWSWKLTPKSAALALQIDKGKYLQSAVLRPGTGPGQFVLDANLAGGGKRSYSGQRKASRPGLVLTAVTSGAEGPQRITLTKLHDSRFLMLLEAEQDGNASAFARLAEVGYTRQGISFAVGDSYPACIVTGGRGTIKVSYQGREYSVCCSGCKDLFEADPEAVIAEAKAKVKPASKP